MKRCDSELHFHSFDSQLKMASNGDAEENSKREHLWKQCKIISRLEDGSLQLNKSNLKVLLHSLDPNMKEQPIVLIGVTGPKSSGKSFYTNLLVQFFKNNEVGGWFAKLTKKKEKSGEELALQGFSFGGVASTDHLLPDNDTSGIYLYTEPLFTRDNTPGKLVWIMHVHYCEKDPQADEKELDSLEILMNLICSRLIEIALDDENACTRKLNIVEVRNALSEAETGLNLQDLCNSIVCLIRTNDKDKLKKRFATEKAKSIKRLQEFSNSFISESCLEGVKYLNVAYIPDFADPLHDEMGCLLAKGVAYDKLRKVTQLFAEDSELVAKTWKGKTVVLKRLARFLSECVLNAEYSFSNEIQQDPANPDSDSNNLPPSVSDKGPMQDNENSSSSLDELARQVTVSNENPSEEVSDKSNKQNQDKNENTQENQIAVDNKQDKQTENFEQEKQAKVSDKHEKQAKDEERRKQAKDEERRKQAKDEERRKQAKDEERRKQAKDEERRKQAKEEEQRKRIEEENRRLEHLVALAFEEAWKLMVKFLNQWVDQLINKNTINDCASVVYAVVQRIETDYKIQYKMTPSFLRKFISMLNEKLKFGKDMFEKVEKTVESFHNKMFNEFASSGCFPDTALKNLIQQHAHSTLQVFSSDPENHYRKFVERAISTLSKCYKEENDIILKTEDTIAQEGREKLLEHFKNKLKSLIGCGPYSPRMLRDIHTHIFLTFLEATKTASRYDPTRLERFKEVLEYDFLTTCKPYMEANASALLSCQKQINGLIVSLKKQYDENMENKLNSAENGVEPYIFENFSQHVRTDVFSQLEKEIKTCFPNEPWNIHQGTLQARIDRSWPSFQMENEKKWENSSSSPSEKMEMGIDPNLKLKTLQPKESHPLVNDASALETFSEKGKAGSSQRPSTSPRPTNQDNILSPIYFQVSLTKILMSWGSKMENGRERFYKHKDITESERYTFAAVVGITRNNVWVCGNEVTDILTQTPGASEFSKIWSIGDLVLKGEISWEEEIYVGEDVQKITVEFLLGMLLQDLKRKWEVEFDGIVQETVIVIPYWVVSSQRQQIKDAGRIAGFQRVSLVNENTAAAYASISQKKHLDPDCITCIFSENSGVVDIAVYSYEPTLPKLKMRGHTLFDGNSKNATNESQSVLQQVVNAGKYVLGYWEDNEEAQAIQQVHNCWKTAWKDTENGIGGYYKRANSYPKEVVTFCESKKWNNVLLQIAKNLTCVKYTEHVRQFAAFGAFCIAKNLENCKEIVKDRICFDILRQSGQNYGLKALSGEDHYLPIGISSPLPLHKNEVHYYQEAFKSRVSIGKLKVINVPKDFQVEPVLEVNLEGIVVFQNVLFRKEEYSYKYMMGHRILKNSAPTEAFQWETPNLSEDQIVKYRSLLDHIKQLNSAASELCHAKEIFVKKCEEMKIRLDAGEGKFRTDLGRNMVLKQISEALTLANHPKLSGTDVENQMELLGTLESKYF